MFRSEGTLFGTDHPYCGYDRFGDYRRYLERANLQRVHLDAIAAITANTLRRPDAQLAQLRRG